MSNPNTIAGDLIVEGGLYAQSITHQAGSIGDAEIAVAAGVQASKLEQQHAISLELYGPAVTIANLTKLFYIARADGTVVQFEAAVVTKATGADRTVSVDLKRSTGGAAFATVLTSTSDFDDGSSNLTPEPAVINTSLDDYEDGDLFEIVVTVAGAAGNQALGLLVTMTVREDAQ